MPILDLCSSLYVVRSWRVRGCRVEYSVPRNIGIRPQRSFTLGGLQKQIQGLSPQKPRRIRRRSPSWAVGTIWCIRRGKDAWSTNSLLKRKRAERNSPGSLCPILNPTGSNHVGLSGSGERSWEAFGFLSLFPSLARHVMKHARINSIYCIHIYIYIYAYEYFGTLQNKDQIKNNKMQTHNDNTYNIDILRIFIYLFIHENKQNPDNTFVLLSWRTHKSNNFKAYDFPNFQALLDHGFNWEVINKSNAEFSGPLSLIVLIVVLLVKPVSIQQEAGGNNEYKLSCRNVVDRRFSDPKYWPRDRLCRADTDHCKTYTDPYRPHMVPAVQYVHYCRSSDRNKLGMRTSSRTMK